MKLELLSVFPSYPDEKEYLVFLLFLSFIFVTIPGSFLRDNSLTLSHCLCACDCLPTLFLPSPLSFEPLNHILFKLYNETLHLL